jgi:hypothetical protein
VGACMMMSDGMKQTKGHTKSLVVRLPSLLKMPHPSNMIQSQHLYAFFISLVVVVVENSTAFTFFPCDDMVLCLTKIVEPKFMKLCLWLRSHVELYTTHNS